MLRAVEKLAGKWEDFGVSLGVNVSDLEAIHSAKTHSPKDCLKDMLKLWLRQCYNVGNDVFVFVFFLFTVRNIKPLNYNALVLASFQAKCFCCGYMTNTENAHVVKIFSWSRISTQIFSMVV